MKGDKRFEVVSSEGLIQKIKLPQCIETVLFFIYYIYKSTF